MKKLTIALMALLTAFSLSACTQENHEGEVTETEISTEASSVVETTTAPDDKDTEDNAIKALQNIIGTEDKTFTYHGKVIVSEKDYSEIRYTCKEGNAPDTIIAKILVDADGNCFIKEKEGLAKIGTPSIPYELEEVYTRGSKVFSKIHFCNFDYDYDNQVERENNAPLVPIKDEHFGTTKEMNEYLNSIFTEEFVNYIKNEYRPQMFNDIDGKLYIQEGGIGSAMGYQFTSYLPVTEEEDHYVFNQKTYCFCEWDENPKVETISEGTLEFVKTDNGWRIKNFTQPD